ERGLLLLEAGEDRVGVVGQRVGVPRRDERQRDVGEGGQREQRDDQGGDHGDRPSSSDRTRATSSGSTATGSWERRTQRRPRTTSAPTPTAAPATGSTHTRRWRPRLGGSRRIQSP